MQDIPLLEKLDWVFTNAEWTSEFPNTIAVLLARFSYDHISVNVQIGTSIPKARLFRFGNYWLEFDGFYDSVAQCWYKAPIKIGSAKSLRGKYGLKMEQEFI
jgi:hypothetical protein